MKRMPVLLTLAAFVVVLGVLGGRALTAQDTGPDKYTAQVPGGARVFRVPGIRILASGLPQSERPCHGGDPRQSGDDQRLPGRHPR